MKITKEFLRAHGACSGGYAWFLACGETDHEKVIEKLMLECHFNWANWLIIRLMDKTQAVRYAINAAKLVLPVFEWAYPNDDRPRKAIEAAKAWAENPCDKTAYAPYASCASYAARAAYASYASARAADDADAASYASYAADAAARASYAAYASYADKMKHDIIDYGLTILKGEK